MAAPGSSSSRQNTENIYEDGSTLLLYHFYPSFYSQRVVFALHEKRLKFKTQVVNLMFGEQFEPSFMKLNPKAEVPVLKDGVKVIPDSSRIIDYLEDNFSNGDIPRLKPEKGSSQFQTMEHFNHLFEKVNVPLITFGCILNPEVAEKMRMSPRELQARISAFKTHLTMLEEFSAQHKDLASQYAAKKASIEKRKSSAEDAKQVNVALDGFGVVLDEVERELATHDGDKEKWWLCGEKFTIADITLSILLHRIQLLGLWSRYFGDSKHPKLAKYFKRVQRKDSYRRTVNPGILSSLCCLGTKEKLAVSLGSVMVVVGIVGLAAFLIHRKK